MDIHTRITGALTLATLLVVASAAAPASAIPEPRPTAPSTAWHRPAPCGLERIGAQAVRCDDLTGLGLDAPAWVDER